jgi:hypothetical protein
MNYPSRLLMRKRFRSKKSRRMHLATRWTTSSLVVRVAGSLELSQLADTRTLNILLKECVITVTTDMVGKALPLNASIVIEKCTQRVSVKIVTLTSTTRARDKERNRQQKTNNLKLNPNRHLKPPQNLRKWHLIIMNSILSSLLEPQPLTN